MSGTALPPLDDVLRDALGAAVSLQQLGDTLPAGVFVTDSGGVCLYANAAVERTLATDAGTLAAQRITAAVHDDDRDRVEHEWLAASRSASDWQSEFRVASSDGAGAGGAVAVHAVPFRHADGRVAGYVGAVADVTLRNRLQNKLTALIETSRLLLESPRLGAVLPAAVQVAQKLIAADGYALWRRLGEGDWRVAVSHGISPAFAATIITAEETRTMGSHFSEHAIAFDDVADAPLLASRAAAYAAEGIRAVLVVPMHVAGAWSGTLVFYYRAPQRFDAIRIQTAAALGNLSAVAIATAELYEEQLEQRQRIERAHAQASFLAEVGSALGSSLDVEASLGALGRLAVPRFADWCAVDLADADGRVRRIAVAHVDPAKVELARAFSERYPTDPESPGSVAHVIRSGQPAMASGITDEMLVAAARDDGHLEALRTLRLTAYIAVPLVAHGRTLGALTFVAAESGRHYDRDDLVVAQAVAERAALAVDNARAYSEARAANLAKDEFLATLSHELRTPLNAIMGWGQILQRGVVDPAKSAHAIDAIVRNAAVQARLIEDLLDLSRIAAGKLRLDVELIDVGAVVAAAVATIEPAAQAKALRLQTVLEAGDARVYGDRQRLQQAVWNLLANAVKFTPRGGRVQTSVLRANSHVSVVVSDTGEGIAADVLPFVFERFRQGDSSSTRSHGGLGLGLAIAKHIVELHGGRVEAVSDGVGSGATFRLSLPVSVAAAMPPSPPPAHPAVRAVTTAALTVALPNLAGTHVLVVEDDHDAREMVAYLLRDRGAEVATAGSVDDGLRAFAARVPDVLLSDIEMPYRDGYALIAAVRARHRDAGGEVPAAALTAYSRPEDRAASMLAGYDAHLSKPVDLHELVATVLRLSTRRRG